ncbi:uncharacterized protein LOC102901879 [Felis catus]|uniref:uncharacterized protein LOC102901879 n=1 Tax=Felis catus TaxID=9685 RepID=UPI001D19B8D6|nr:uncharacterized protein LOC102901879 [Felis catus]
MSFGREFSHVGTRAGVSVRVLWQEEVHLDGTWKRIGQRDDFIEARAGRGTARTPGATGTSCGGQSPPPLRPLGSWSHEGGTPRGWGLRSWRGAAVTGAWRDGSSSPSPASARPNWNSENNGAQNTQEAAVERTRTARSPDRKEPTSTACCAQGRAGQAAFLQEQLVCAQDEEVCKESLEVWQAEQPPGRCPCLIPRTRDSRTLRCEGRFAVLILPASFALRDDQETHGVIRKSQLGKEPLSDKRRP